MRLLEERVDGDVVARADLAEGLDDADGVAVPDADVEERLEVAAERDAADLLGERLGERAARARDDVRDARVRRREAAGAAEDFLVMVSTLKCSSCSSGRMFSKFFLGTLPLSMRSLYVSSLSMKMFVSFMIAWLAFQLTSILPLPVSCSR